MIYPLLYIVRGKIEYYRTPPSYEPGFNLSKMDCFIDAVDDWAAVREFLNTFKNKMTTLKLYAKEIERLLLWLIERDTPLNGMKPGDWSEYLDFLADPKPYDLWCGKKQRKFMKDGSVNFDWRVFVNQMKDGSRVHPGLSKTSILKTKRIISSLFAFLCTNGYTMCNIINIQSSKSSNTESERVIKQRTNERMIRMDLVDFVLGIQKHRINVVTAQKGDVFYPIRARFIIALLVNTGLRISELALHKMGDIMTLHNNPNHWFLRIKGKGDVERDILLFDRTLDIVKAFRAAIGLGEELPKKGDITPLIPKYMSSHGGSFSNQTLSSGRVHEIIKEAFGDAARAVENHIDDYKGERIYDAMVKDIEVLSSVSAHWLRHTHATDYLKRNNGNFKAVMDRLGHASINTTMIYQHVSQEINNEKSDDDRIFLAELKSAYGSILNKYRSSI